MTAISATRLPAANPLASVGSQVRNLVVPNQAPLSAYRLNAGFSGASAAALGATAMHEAMLSHPVPGITLGLLSGLVGLMSWSNIKMGWPRWIK